MTAYVHTFAFQGVEARRVEVQVSLTGGLPSFMLVGLADKAVGESRERVRAALSQLGLALPAKRITVNLAPADLSKEGSHFDLPIALSLLISLGLLDQSRLESFYALGELSLDGRLLPVAGVLSAALGSRAAEKGLICPEASGAEAAWVEGIVILALPTLSQLVSYLKDEDPPPLETPTPRRAAPRKRYVDFADIKGQDSARRSVEIAAAGGHNLLMSGPPGAGKSMLAERFPALLPPMRPSEILETALIQSIAGEFLYEREKAGPSDERPFRAPHHSASLPSLVGGGRNALPGEVSLAHNGVLFLDELPEFSRQTLEALRQPLENGSIAIARAHAHVTYPARFQLIAAMNPCRCGYLADPARACRKAPLCAEDYQKRISGPLLDRIDLFFDVPPVVPYSLADGAPGESSATIAKRVLRARERQYERYEQYKARGYEGTPILCNAHLPTSSIEQWIALESDAAQHLRKSAEKFSLSARGYYRTLRVARTIADLDGRESISKDCVSEAVHFRRLSLRPQTR